MKVKEEILYSFAHNVMVIKRTHNKFVAIEWYWPEMVRVKRLFAKDVDPYLLIKDWEKIGEL